ncbi:MAG: hypothetical protein ABR910_17070 [Acidobacteriaceae bacterium]
MGILCLGLFAAGAAKEIRAQQQFLPTYDVCGGNADCASYRGDFDLLVHEDSGPAAPPGKRPENRSHILLEADNYLKEHGRESAYGAYFRYLSCVSGALWSERGDTRTLFSTENILETFFALAGRAGENARGIERACTLLGAYHTRLEEAREEQSILQSEGGSPDPESVWHGVLLDDVRRQAPKADAEASVRRDQERYCLFAQRCRGAENSPFAGK